MFFWLLFTLLATVHGNNEICPDGAVCSGGATCCELADKSYGCCPLEKAVCCDDHIHCCPQNTKCEAGSCLQLSGLNVTAKKLFAKDENIHCFGSKYVCPDTFTCCKGPKPGLYGCCPLTHAVCCSDGVHCCPDGTVCDVKEGKCLGKGYVSEMFDSHKNKLKVHEFLEYSPLIKPNISSVICPNSSFRCPDGYTCCKLPNGDWGCCPFINATCCSDHSHCCPQNMQCDSTSRACFQGHVYIPSLLKELSTPVNAQIICPDNSSCAESMTCCELSQKHFGCCQYTDAVCCEDHRHCCPSDFICDVIGKRCIPKQKGLYSTLSKHYKILD